MINFIKNIFTHNNALDYITEFSITSHPTLSRPIVDTFINDVYKEIDYYNRNSLGRVYKAILQMNLLNTRRKFKINSWIGTDFDRGRYKFHDAIYSIEDARIRAGEIVLGEIRENGIDFEIYRNVAIELNKLQDRAAIIKLFIEEFKANKINVDEFFIKVENIYQNDPFDKILQIILTILSTNKQAKQFFNFIKEYGLDLSQNRHFRLDGTLLINKSTIDNNILKTIDLAVKNHENVAIIIANTVSAEQIKILEQYYKEINGEKAILPRIIPLVEDSKSVQYFIDNYSIIEKYLDSDKEVMLAGSDMTKSGGFFSAQYTLFNFMSNIKKAKLFLGSGTTIFRTGGQLQISRLRHKIMTVFAGSNLKCYNQTLQGGGISFEGIADRSVVDLLRNYSKIRANGNDKYSFNCEALKKVSDIANNARKDFFKQYEQDFNDLISTKTELTTFGVSILNDFGGSRDGAKIAFLDFIQNSRAIQFYACFLNLGIAPIAIEMPENFDEFKNIIKTAIQKQDISMHYLLTVAAIQVSYADLRFLEATEIPITLPIIQELVKKTKLLQQLLDELGYNTNNKNLLNIIAEEWRIDNFNKLKDNQKIEEIEIRKKIIYSLLKLKIEVAKNGHLDGSIEIIKYINFAINDVKINGTNKQIEYLINYVTKNLENKTNFVDHFAPYSFYGVNKIVPYKN